MQHQQEYREEMLAEHKTALQQLSVQLDEQSLLKETEYMNLSERSMQRILHERQSKLHAIVDTTTLNNEHKEQVLICWVRSIA